MLAILIGVAIRTTWTPGPRWVAGINLSAKFILEFAIVLLGASFSVTMIAALGPALIIGIAGIVAVAIGTSYLICRLLRLPRQMSILVACGNSICGNSAITAVAPVIGADAEDVAASISMAKRVAIFIAVRNVEHGPPPPKTRCLLSRPCWKFGGHCAAGISLGLCLQTRQSGWTCVGMERPWATDTKASVKTWRNTSLRSKSETGDAQACSSDNTAAACATVRRCCAPVFKIHSTAYRMRF